MLLENCKVRFTPGLDAHVVPWRRRPSAAWTVSPVGGLDFFPRLPSALKVIPLTIDRLCTTRIASFLRGNRLTGFIGKRVNIV
jgi:hypothetical protein